MPTSGKYTYLAKSATLLLKSFQLCKSAQTYRYRKYFEHIVARFQGDSSCVTIDNIKPELCPNSSPLYNPMSVVDNSARLFFHSSHSTAMKWLEWKNNRAEVSTTDIGLYNGAEFRQSSGFMLSMVKQLESPWNLATMCSKYFRYRYV